MSGSSFATPVDSGHNSLPVLRTRNHQFVTIGAASAQSTAVGSNTRVLRISTDIDCFYLIGANPTVSGGGDGDYLPAGAVEYRHCSPADKVAVIQKSTAGSLFISEAY
jgi:hypothetical protein